MLVILHVYPHVLHLDRLVDKATRKRHRLLLLWMRGKGAVDKDAPKASVTPIYSHGLGLENSLCGRLVGLSASTKSS